MRGSRSSGIPPFLPAARVWLHREGGHAVWMLLDERNQVGGLYHESVSEWQLHYPCMPGDLEQGYALALAALRKQVLGHQPPANSTPI